MPDRTLPPLITTLLVILLLLPAPSLAAQDAQTILQTVEDRQADRWSTVDNYTITKAVEVAGGAQSPMYYEKFDADGQTLFRLVMPGEYSRQVMTDAGFPPPGPDALDQMAEGYEMVGGALSSGGGDMPPMPGAGLMMGGGAEFLRAAADAERNENDGRDEAKKAASDMEEFASRARLEGRAVLDMRQIVRDIEAQFAEGDSSIVSWVPDEALQSRDAFLLVVDDLSGLALDQPKDGGEFTLQKASLWIDTEHYVPLRLLMEGEVENKGKKNPLIIEKFNLDYRKVGPLYEPFAEVFRMSGMMAGMSDKDRKEMEKARKDIAKAKAQLEAMPASQRAMVEKMMKGQLEKAEKMLAGDAIVTSVRTVSLAVNEGPPTPYGPGSLTVGSVTFPGALTVAAERADDAGSVVANLSVAARDGTTTEASVELTAASAFPDAGGSVPITGGGGWARYPGQEGASFDDASGMISVTARTDTHIVGTFTATMTGTGDDGNAITAAVNGSFDTGAPAGPDQAPRGSPFPADIFETGPPTGSPAAGGDSP